MEKAQRHELLRAVALAGSQARLARELKISRTMVNHWLSGLSPLSIARARQIERWSRGKIKKEKLVFG